jgi:sodium/proline symporter
VSVSIWVLLPLIVYLAILVGLGLWSRAAGGSMEGYFVAGKRLPSWVIAFSTNATGESGWLLLGLTGMGYAVGIHALWVVLGEVLGVTLGWVLVARRFKAYTDRYGAITVPDFLEQRFADGSKALRAASVLIILSMVTTYCCAQLVASGKAFSSFLGVSYGVGVLIGTVVTLFYTAVGGFKAVAYSDVVQGVLMAAGLLVLPVVGFVAAGGWGPVMGALGAADPALLEPMGEHGVTWPGILSAASFATIGLAFLGVPQLLVRFMSARDDREIIQGSLYSVLCILAFDFGAVFTGIAGRALFGGLDDPETVMPTMSHELFPAVFTGVFLVVVLGAIMSTVDSLLILASSAVVRDGLQKIFGATASDASLARWGRWTTLAIGALALPFALAEVKVIFWFILFAWSGLAAAFTPVVLLALFWKRTTRAGALAGMIGGFVTTVGWVLLLKARYYDLYEMIPGFLVGMALTVVVSLITAPPPGAAAEMDEVRTGLRAGRRRWGSSRLHEGVAP